MVYKNKYEYEIKVGILNNDNNMALVPPQLLNNICIVN